MKTLRCGAKFVGMDEDFICNLPAGHNSPHEYVGDIYSDDERCPCSAEIRVSWASMKRE